jgi:hypothetical protein
MHGYTPRGNRESHGPPVRGDGPCREVRGRTPTMNGPGESDRLIVPRQDWSAKRWSASGGGDGGKGPGPGELGPANHRPDAVPGPCVTCAGSGTPGRFGGLASLPEAGAGCGSAARPDLWRGRRVTAVPTPTPRIVTPAQPALEAKPAIPGASVEGDFLTLSDMAAMVGSDAYSMSV